MYFTLRFQVSLLKIVNNRFPLLTRNRLIFKIGLKYFQILSIVNIRKEEQNLIRETISKEIKDLKGTRGLSGVRPKEKLQ